MARSPRILTERVALAPFCRKDITEEYLGWLNDNALMRYSRQSLYPHSRETCEDYLRSFEFTQNFFWNVTRREDGAQVGTATAYVDRSDDVADVGLLIGYSGLGYGNEVFGAVMAYLFITLGMRKVTAGTAAGNVAMARIARRWGMMLEGTLRAQQRLRSTISDVYLFGILQAEWRAGGESPIRQLLAEP